MRPIRFLLGALSAAILAGPALGQEATKEDAASIAELKRQIEALQRRVEELESGRKSKPTATAARRNEVPAPAHKPAPAYPVTSTPTPAYPVTSTSTPAYPVIAVPPPRPVPTTIPGLLPPEPMSEQFEDALRSDLPGLSIRIPGTLSEVRFYGFAKVSAWADFNGRNQTGAPTVQTIPLTNSPADMQGGDFGMTPQFSRFGMDSRTLTALGTLETRFEGDFGGTAAPPFPSVNHAFRLRQAWAELGTESFRVLIGQANSLWNEGMYETLIDSTNLNQSFIRQAQIRATATLAPGWIGQISLEAPETQYTSVDGIFTPGTSPIGGLSPAITNLPDLLGRLNYSDSSVEFEVRGLARELSIRTAGTAVAPPGLTLNTLGWGAATHARVFLHSLSEAFGADQLIGMGYYGQGIGRYFAGNSFGQDALSNIGLPVTNFSLDALPTYGATVAYRRFWIPQLRSNIAYSWAWQEYPSYALAFIPGSPSAVFLNNNMQQGIVNLIWSPFAQYHDGVVDTGWLDIGVEYIYSRRNVFGGDAATLPASLANGTANRILGAATGRF